MRRISPRQRRQLSRSVVALCLVILIAASGIWLAHPGQRAHAAYTPTKLLLVHGFNDTCQYAFNKIGQANQGPSPTTAATFLGNSGWSNSWTGIDEVGYYNPTQAISGTDSVGNPYTTYDSTPSDSPAGNCNHNLFRYSDQTAGTYYDPNTYNCHLLKSADTYFLNDPIQHIACVFAWYVYDTYTHIPNPIAVEILAHSMGGLIVRDAIGESGQGTCGVNVCNSYFPPGRLMVTRVVTVATPHGGETGFYLDEAKAGFTHNGNVVQEVQDMDPTSTGDGFMQHIGAFQAPQGVVPPGTVPLRTYWALMAGSNVGACADNSTGYVSCLADGSGENYPYPDGDGIVPADSALSMSADFKILYGEGTCFRVCVGPQGSPEVVYQADLTHNGAGDSQYSHEANTCDSGWFLFIKFTGCLSNPFYLNDGTPANQTTYAWICSDNTTPCPNAGGITDLKVIVNGLNGISNPQPGQPAPHSLAEIASLLPPPGPPPPPTPTPTPTTPPPPTCSYTYEVDNTIVGSGYMDYRGNTWDVYYDIKRDTPTGQPCQMRVVVRIFNPAPDGAWNGTAAVWAYKGTVKISASIGKVSGSGTYAAHFVWRGPWFSASSGSYSIADVEYNGSNYYTRATGGFSL